MGTTLTGTTPQDTYDSLIKVTDNGPLSGSLKKLTDGLGNDSALSLSTGAASITGTLASTAGANFATSSGNVGIGTGSPSYKLDTRGIAAVFNAGIDGVTAPTLYLGHPSYTTTYLNKISTSVSAAAGGQVMQFSVANGASTYADVMTLNGSGNVGIGTSSPSSPLTVYKATSPDVDIQNSSALHRITGDAGSLLIRADYGNTAANTHIQFSLDGTEVGRFTPNGLTFNGDTAAANALDDYEEGTWTMGFAFGGGTTGITYGSTLGKYTKIGNKVTVVGAVSLTNKGSSTGDATITGLPFAIAGGSSSWSAPSIWVNSISFANQIQARGVVTQTNIQLWEVTEAGALSSITNADFVNTSEVILSFTYFV